MSKKSRKQNNGIPEVFLERLTTIVGSSLFREVEKTFAERPTTFRVNSIKTPASPARLAEASAKRAGGSKHENIKTGEYRDSETVRQQSMRTFLEEQGFKVRQIPWYKDAFILLNKSKRDLLDLDIYKNGEIYIQSLASMVPPIVLDPKPGEKVLDLTAAPGSKTSQIAAMMSPYGGSASGGDQQGELIANDNNKVRFFKLKHNMEMLGVSATLRMEHGAVLCHEYPAYFDKILLDAPCSAEARFIDGQPKTYGYWNERKVKEMAYKQRSLLLGAWSALKPGGTLVYSTCTFAPEENEANIHLLCDRYGDEVEVLPIAINGLKVIRPVKAWKSKVFHPPVARAMRILPTQEIEGFFVAKLRKIT